MSNITLPNSLGNAKIMTFTRLDGSDVESIQAVANVNPLPVLAGQITVNGGTVEFDIADAVTLVLAVTGTYGSVAIAFEASIDGTNWFPVMGVQTDAATFVTASGTLSSTNRAWEFGVSGFARFRVRATAYTSGTMVVTCGRSPLGYDPAGMNQVTLVAGAALIGNVGVSGKTTGGAIGAKLVSAATTNATALKTSAGTLYGGRAFNAGAAPCYLKFYNKASAPTVGTDVPILVIGIPQGQTVDLGIGNSIGIAFATGIAYAITTGAADTDTGAVALNQVTLALSYT
jgi:hypothetical protein